MMMSNNHEYWPKGPSESLRIREYAEAQWERIKNEVPREKGAFLRSLKEVTDNVIGHSRPTRSAHKDAALDRGYEESKSSYFPMVISPEMRIASTSSLASMKKMREQMFLGNPAPVPSTNNSDRLYPYESHYCLNGVAVGVPDVPSSSAGPRTARSYPSESLFDSSTVERAPAPPSAASPLRSTAHSTTQRTNTAIGNQQSRWGPSAPSPLRPSERPHEARAAAQAPATTSGHVDSAAGYGGGQDEEEGDEEASHEEEGEEDLDEQEESERGLDGELQADDEPCEAAESAGHPAPAALQAEPLPSPLVSRPPAVTPKAPSRTTSVQSPAVSTSTVRESPAAPASNGPVAMNLDGDGSGSGVSNAAAQSMTAQQKAPDSAHIATLSEQALRLEAWERELRERERQLLDYRDSLARPLGAKLPPRTVAEAPADVEHPRGWHPDIHIHNHLPGYTYPAPAAPAAPPQAPLLSSSTDTAPVGERARFPYDRAVDYDSAGVALPAPALPGFPFDYEASLGLASPAPSAVPRPSPALKPTYTAAYAPTPLPDLPRSSFADKHALLARLSHDFPTLREPAAQSNSRNTSSGGKAAVTASAEEEVDLSGLSLARIRELTGRY